MSHSGLRRVAPGVAAALIGIFLAGTSAVLFRPPGTEVAFWWPAAGLAVALVGSMPRRHAPALGLTVLVVSFVANVTGGQEWELSAWFGVGNALEAVVAGLLLKDAAGRLVTLDRLGDFVRLVLAAVAGATAIGVVGATGAAVLGEAPFLLAFRILLTSHTAAVMVIVPVVMAWQHRTAAAGRAEYAAQVVTMVAVTAVLFAPEHPLPLSFLILPVLVWGALRLDPRTVTLELFLTCFTAIVLTAQGRGPFGDFAAGDAVSPELAGPLVQGYMLATTLVTLPLSIVVAQRARALAVLTEREELFRRNFTESMTGMLLLGRRGDRLEIVDANETAQRLLGDGESSVVGRYLDGVLDSSSALRSAIQEMVEGQLDGWRGQVPVTDRPGSQVKVALSPLSKGEEATFSAQLLDVSAEYAALARTAAAERLTSATLDTTNCLILVTDMAGTVVRVNHATTTLTGFTEKELLGRPVWESIAPPHLVATARSVFASRDGSEVPGSRETDVQTAGGDTLRVVWNADLVRDEDGEPRYAVLTGVDVTAERITAGLMANLFQAGMATAIIGIDNLGRITLVNSGAQELLGWDAEELRGRQFVELLDPEELAERTSGSSGTGWSALTASLEDGRESELTDWTWVTANGARRTVATTISGGGSRFGPQAGYLVVGRDVTEQRHSQMMLMAALQKERVAADRLRQLDAAKNEFVSTVSHELRTPVTSIVGYTEMLADGAPVPPHPSQLPLLDTIARNGSRLIALCNDLLTLSGLDSDGPEWTRHEIDLRDLVGQVEESLQPMVRDRDLGVTFTTPARPVRVLGDGIQLERVLLNLLNNAVKFTPDGGRVTTWLDTREGEALLVVADTGIGIPGQELDALFQKFFRASTAQDLAIPGTGLGLSIVAGIVAAHGGRIQVESEPGTGTTFTVRLPLAPS